MLKLYGFPLSQPTRAVLMLLKESSTPYQFVLIDALKGENRRNPEFKSSFPGNAVVPAIDDGGFKLMESAAILQYIAETRKLDTWYPRDDAQARARIGSWMHWHHTNTRHSTKGILRPNLFTSLPDREGVLERGKRDFSTALKHLEVCLAKTKFLAGDSGPSLADLLILCEIDQLYPESFNLFDFGSSPHTRRWVADCRSSIKSYQEVFDPVIEISKKMSKK
jgi:glutathione S-transferase